MNDFHIDKIIMLCVLLGYLLGLVTGFFTLISYTSYQQDNFSNQIDVCQHLGSVTTVNSVPHGQTVRFSTININSNGGDQFSFWLQAMQQYNITTVYSVPKGAWGLTYRGAALYFTYKGVIYLYQ